MEVEGDVLTFQQNERNNEEGRKEATPSAVKERATEKEAKRRGREHCVKYISRRRCIYLNVRQRRSLLHL